MLSEVRRKKLHYFFTLLDLNRNGLLQFDDFSDLAERVRLSLSCEVGDPQHKKIAEKATHLFHHLLSDIDPEKPQSIHVDEWLAFFGENLNDENDEVLSVYQQLIYSNIFDFFDQNRDGFITQDEFETLFEIFGIEKNSLTESFNLLDVNGDKKVSRYELLAAIEDFLISDDEDSPGNWIFGDWKASIT